MKRAYFVCLFQCLTTTFLLPQSNPAALSNQRARVASPISAAQADQKAQAKILDSYGKLPLSFEANHGQTDGRVKFFSRTGGYTLFLTADEAVFTLSGKTVKESSPPRLKPVSLAGSGGTAKAMPFPKAIHVTSSSRDDVGGKDTTGSVLRMKLRNVNPAAKVTGLDELAGTSNYFIGNDPAKWHSGVPTYAKVKYEGIYSGIDLVYYGNQQHLEYDFVVAPGADPRRIAFDIRGAKRIRRNEHGDLVLKMKMGEGEIRWHKPVAYQEKDGTRQLVAARYAIRDTNRVGFEVAKYDASSPLYIDPLIYSTYLGGSGNDVGQGVAVDHVGNAYVTGYTFSTDFPTKNPLQAANAGLYNAFVAKMNAAGSALFYSTYLGGNFGDEGSGIAVDSSGNAYVTGTTASTDFPTKNPLQPASGGGGDAFVAKINPTGSALVYSTYLGGSDNDDGIGIVVDSARNAYVTGDTFSTNFPTKNPLQAASGSGLDAFVSKINPTGSTLVYSTYLGGSGLDQGDGIAVDSAGNAYVVGTTGSTDFPTKNPLQGANAGGEWDAFVAKINPAGSALVYSTYLGGSGLDGGVSIAVDSAGSAYVAGNTFSTNFPTMNPLQSAYGGGGDIFVAKLNPTGSTLLYSTYLGGSRNDRGGIIALDSASSAYVTGSTSSTNFPRKGSLQNLHGPDDAFVSKLNPSGSALVYSTYLGGQSHEQGGGIAVDSADNAYVTGYTNSLNFPTMNPLQPANGGGGDVFVAKIYIAAVTTTTLSSSRNPSIYGQAVIFTAVVTSGLGAPPDGETVTFMKGTTVLGTVALSGGSARFTTSTLPVGTDYIKAAYGGDSTFGSSKSTTLKQVVDKATTTTTLTSSQNPSNLGQSVTFTASIAPQFSGTVHGTVTFYDGTMALKTASLSGGVAKFTTSTLASGKHNIKATYNGSTNFSGSSASLTQTVN
jgi:Bacterial Ig-like domain (group 3)/Beta-propeller repeat